MGDLDVMSIAPTPTEDPLLYRLVVGALGLVALIAVLGLLVLAAIGKAVPEGVVAMGGAAIGGLVGLLAPSPVR